ncbi:MAG TPA: VOC family protein [Actinophytocola sp.]|uniref:VOC family protein n=1 Tax=Actinophytocola sp. TaxID=1872138 RepID=UPI002DB7A387|nr:VOC family protein [Actinophytocola sp.]HEU5471016.1 VOC family protein [Actinophytocola sp.]
MAVRFAQWTLDVQDPELMADFWSQALGFKADRGEDGSVMLYPPAGAPPDVPNLWLQNTGGPKRGKNRNHPDLRPVDGDVDGEVERLIGLGARRTDVGQTGTEGFVVLADPEGNEFCVLRHEPHGR